MFRRRSLPLGGQAVMTAVVGIACGTAAALWSVGTHSNGAPAVQASSPAIVTESSSVSRGETPAPASLIPAASKTTLSAAVPAKPDGQDVRLRARALAAQPDVKALVALRETVVRRAEAQGETEAAASKQLLDDLDRYLEGARELRLKLDAEELRKAGGSQRR